MARKAGPTDRPLPADVLAEQFILGSVFLSDSIFPQVAAALNEMAWTVERNRKIYRAMKALYEAGKKIEYLSVANELRRRGELESVDGVAYLSSLTEGLPRVDDLGSYLGIVKEKALLRQLIYASQKTMALAWEGHDSAETIVQQAQSELFEIVGDGASVGYEKPHTIVQNFPGGLNAFLDPSKRARGLQTGFTRFDEMTGGLRGGELIVVAARPGVGKTSFSSDIALFAALRHQKSVLFFSLEMSKVVLLERMCCSVGRVDAHRFRGGYLNQEERRRLSGALNTITQSNLAVDDSCAATVMDLYNACRRFSRSYGLDLVVVDYLQLLAGERTKTSNREQEVAGVSRGLKRLSKDLSVPVLALAQLSRRPEQRPGDHKPILSDIRETGSIEADADIVVFIHRASMYFPDRSDLQGKAELLLSKSRNGPCGTIQLAFLERIISFANLADDPPGAPHPDPDVT